MDHWSRRLASVSLWLALISVAVTVTLTLTMLSAGAGIPARLLSHTTAALTAGRSGSGAPPRSF